MSTTRSMITSTSSVQLDEKYFGKSSKRSFVDTYRQLKHHGELLVGGYNELDKLISKPMEENILAKTVADLKLAGVISPRRALGNPPERPDGASSEPIENIDKKGRKLGLRLMDDDNESGTFLTKVGFSDDENEDRDEFPEPDVPLGGEMIGLDSMSELGGTFSQVPDGGIHELGSLDFSAMGSSVMTAQEEEDAATDFSYRTQSPRAIFINGCLKNKIPPITIALVRRNLTSTINLAHMGIGDKIAGILAGCLSSLPYLQVLNLADNNLADKGLSELLLSAAKHKEIEELDISNNTVGTAASKALGAFLANPGCKLKSLRLRDANIDDAECANICGVLKHNTNLRELDLSKNQLGKDENLNVVKPEFVTGGESLAELLHQGTCPIEKLVLHWNMIRLDGALALCNAIHANRYLTDLDLSYNAIASAGAEILGKSLLENSMLTKLNVAHNNIDAVGCFTLCIGIGENTTLRELNLDGNPIGAHGCMILTKTVLASGPLLNITAQRCDLLIKHDHVKFDITDCAGTYALDMNIPYERAILIAIMRAIAVNPNINVKALELPSDTGKASSEAYTVSRDMVPRTDLTEDELRDVEVLRAANAVRQLDYQHIMEICKEYDLEDSDRFDTAVLDSVLGEVGMPYDEASLIEMKFLLDPFQYHFIEIRGFALYIINLCEKATQLLSEITHTRKIAIESAHSGGKIDFIAPKRGIAKVTVVEAFAQGAADSSMRLRGMLHRKVKRVIDSAHKSTNSLAMLACAMEGSIFYLEEAKLLFTHLFAILDDPVAAVAMILPHMAGPFDANILIKCCLGYDMKKIRRLAQKLGPIYSTITGACCGHYAIDFSDPLSRKCWQQLLAKSLDVKMRRRFDNFGELTQHGDGIYCFRNIHIVKPFTVPAVGASAAAAPAGAKQWDVPTGMDAEREALLAPLMDVSTVPKVGKVEFDFVNSTLPDFSGVNANLHTLSDDSFIRIINACQLLEDRDVDNTLDRLLHYMKQSRKMMLTSGYQYWTPSINHAIATGDKLYELYSSLNTRKRSIETISKRESIEVDLSNDPLHLQFKIPPSLRSRFLVSLKTQRAEKYVSKFTALISTFGRSVRLVSKNAWINKLRSMMNDARPSGEYRSVHMVEYLTFELVHRWIYCRQLAVVIQLFQFGMVLHSNFGSYRVQLIVKLFDRIVDLHNFQFVLMHLNSHEHAALLARLGVLNLYNPCTVSGGLQLDLSRWEERQLVKMLIHLSTVESGENFRDEEYAHDRNHVPMPGWELKVTWFQEDSLPHKGILSLDVYSGEGMGIQDCQVNRAVRNMMMSLVLPQQRNLHDEIEHDQRMTCLMIQDSASAYSRKENRMDYSPSTHVPLRRQGSHLGGVPDGSARLRTVGNNSIATPLALSNHVTTAVNSLLSTAANTPPHHIPALPAPAVPTSALHTPSMRTPVVPHSPAESCDASIQDTSDVILLDAGMQLLYPQLSVFEHYETGVEQALGHRAGSPKANTKRLSVEATYAAQAGWLQTGSSSRFMKTYRLDDLQANLKNKTSIGWSYVPPQAGGNNRAAVASRGTSRGNG